MSSAIKTPAFQAKASNILNEDNSSIYSGGEWSFKNASAVTGFHVDASGNVGVGVTPLTQSTGKGLEVGRAGNGITSWFNNNNIVANMYYDSVDKFAGTGYAMQYIQDPANGVHAWRSSSASGTADGSASMIERMRIDASGRLDLGPTTHTNPTYKGNIRLWGGGRSADGGIEFAATDFQYGFGFRIINPDDGAGSTPLVFQVRNNSTSWVANAFTLYNNGNYAFAGSNVSDERLKEDIQDIDNQLQNVLALAPKTFRFKAQTQEDGSVGQPGHIRHGFIAQEVKAVIPKLVTGAETNPDEYMGVDCMGLTSILVKAIQEQQAMIEELKAKVSALESK